MSLSGFFPDTLKTVIVQEEMYYAVKMIVILQVRFVETDQ